MVTEHNERTEELAQQLTLLTTHRRTLAHLLRQAAIFGLLTPPHVVHSIEEARSAIAQLKGELRAIGVAVDDAPGDLPGTAPIERRARRIRFLSTFIIAIVLVTTAVALSGGVVGMRMRLD